MDFAISIILYLLGALFMTMHFEPEEGGPPYMYYLFVFFWPMMTLYFLLQDMTNKPEE